MSGDSTTPDPFENLESLRLVIDADKPSEEQGMEVPHPLAEALLDMYEEAVGDPVEPNTRNGILRGSKEALQVFLEEMRGTYQSYGQDKLLPVIDGLQGYLSMAQGDTEWGRQQFLLAAEQCDDPEAQEMFMAMEFNYFHHLLGKDDYEEIHRFIEARREAELSPEQVTRYLTWEARTFDYMGRTDDAIAALDRAIEAFAEQGQHEQQAGAIMIQQMVLMRRGKPEDMLRAGEAFADFDLILTDVDSEEDRELLKQLKRRNLAEFDQLLRAGTS